MKNNKINSTRMLPFVVGLAFALALGGCGSASQQSSSSDGSQNVTSAQSASTSSATSASQNISLDLKNETGFTVSSLAFRASGENEYSQSYTFEGFEIANGSSTNITFAPIMKDGKPAEKYDILVKTPDGGVMEMPNVDLAHLQNLTLKFEDSVGYMEYTNPESGITENNKEESEQAIEERTNDVKTFDQQSQLG